MGLRGGVGAGGSAAEAESGHRGDEGEGGGAELKPRLLREGGLEGRLRC